MNSKACACCRHHAQKGALTVASLHPTMSLWQSLTHDFSTYSVGFEVSSAQSPFFRLKSVQAASAKQAARHSQEIEELLLELSKQHAAAQAALPQQGTFPQGSPQQGTFDEARMSKRALPNEGKEEDVATDSLTPQAPRLTTPASPSRRPSTHPRGFHNPSERTPTPFQASQTGDRPHKDDSLRAERGRSFSNSFGMSKQHPMCCASHGSHEMLLTLFDRFSHRIQTFFFILYI